MRGRPSGNTSYPVDIAVFTSDEKTQDNLYIIVECKDETVPLDQNAKDQLIIYMNMSAAKFGVLHRPDETLIFSKNI